MSLWAGKILQFDQTVYLLKGKLDFLSRQANDVLLSSKKIKEKVEALNTSLKIAEAQMKWQGKEGLCKNTKHEVKQSFDYALPYESNPVIMEAYRKASEQQKIEKENDKKNLKSGEAEAASP